MYCRLRVLVQMPPADLETNSARRPFYGNLLVQNRWILTHLSVPIRVDERIGDLPIAMKPGKLLLLGYSARSAATGFTDAARCAGI